MTKIYIDVSPSLSSQLDEKTLNIIISEFIKYKEDGGKEDLPVPTVRIQKKFKSANPQFGRDRYDTAYKSVDIQHLHLMDSNAKWDSGGGLLAQWHCTSDTHLIYSYFKHAQNYYFYLVEIYSIDAHQSYLKAQNILINEVTKFKEEKLQQLESSKSA